MRGWAWGAEEQLKKDRFFFPYVLLPLLHNCHLLYTVDAGVVSVMLWGKITERLASPSLLTCGLATGDLGFRGFFVCFFFLLPLCFSHDHQNRPVTGFPAVYFSSLKLYKHNKSHTVAASWWNDVKNQGHSHIYCTRAGLKQLQMASLFYFKRAIYLREVKTLLLQLLAVALQTPSL